VAGREKRQSEQVRQFVVNALAMHLLLGKFPGLVQLLGDLRYEVQTGAAAPGLGTLPLVTLSACVPSFRPSDDLILAATRLSGVPAFIELIEVEAVHRLQDPLKTRLEEMLG
jgi:hypothetical protein